MINAKDYNHRYIDAIQIIIYDTTDIMSPQKGKNDELNVAENETICSLLSAPCRFSAIFGIHVFKGKHGLSFSF